MKKKLCLLIITGIFLLTSCKSEAVKITETAIKNIGTVSLESESLINEAQKKYDALTEKQKNQVNNYNDLIKAKDEFNGYKYIDLAEKLYNKIEESELDFSAKIDFFSGTILTSYIFNADNVRAITSSTDPASIQIRNEPEELYTEFKSMTAENEDLQKAVEEYYISYEQLCDLLLDYNFTQTNFTVLADSYKQNYQDKKENIENVLTVIKGVEE